MTAIGLAPDGLTIAIGTENGVIGCLDVPTHQYRTLLRSHTDTINAVAVDTHRCCLPCSPLCTACNLMQSVANVCCLHGQACELADISEATLPGCASLSSICSRSESICQIADVLLRGVQHPHLSCPCLTTCQQAMRSLQGRVLHRLFRWDYQGMGHRISYAAV